MRYICSICGNSLRAVEASDGDIVMGLCKCQEDIMKQATKTLGIMGDSLESADKLIKHHEDENRKLVKIIMDYSALEALRGIPIESMGRA